MQDPSSFRLGRCEVQPLERRLLVDGVPAQIGARAFDLLLALIEKRGQVLTKSQLLDEVWPGLVVEENNLAVHVSALRKLLGPDAIATVPGRGYRLAVSVSSGAGSAASSAPIEAPASTTSAAPIQFELVGRDEDLTALATQIGVVALLSIVGSGGVGKTSLARAALTRHNAHWRDGVHWIELAPLHDAAQIAIRIAQSLEVELGSTGHARAGLLATLSQRQALIVLDNCEQLLGPIASLVADALARAPGIRWLITSQEPLRLAQETVYRLQTLAVPTAGTPLASAANFSAVALLAGRARAADRRFALTQANIDAAIEVCRQLDGLPLAIEMAAARVATLGLQGVRERIGQRLRVLTGSRGAPARQQTLRAALDWSHALLSDPEQRVFRRLAPFVGGFTAEMAQQVGSDADAPVSGEGLDAWAALDCLSSLVDKSLVQAGAGDRPRYYLLESAREYADEKLTEASERAVALQRHAASVAERFAPARADADVMRDSEWLAHYLPERDNLRAALGWACRSDDADLLARLVAALGQMDYLVLATNGMLEFDIPFELLARAAAPLRGAACVEYGWAHYLGGSRARGADLSRQAVDAYREAGDKVGVYRALSQLVRLYEAGLDQRERAQEAWAAWQEIDDRDIPLRTRTFCAICLGTNARYRQPGVGWTELMTLATERGYDASAAVCRVNLTNESLVGGRFEECVKAARAFIDAGETRPRARAHILSNQAEALMHLGHFDDAVEAARAAMNVYPDALYLIADTLAMGAIKRGRLRDAAILTGYNRAVRQERRQRPDPAEAKMGAANDIALRDGLPASELERLLAEGAAMSSSELFALAIGSGRQASAS